jgi:hypothetical protein
MTTDGSNTPGDLEPTWADLALAFSQSAKWRLSDRMRVTETSLRTPIVGPPAGLVADPTVDGRPGATRTAAVQRCCRHS